MGPSTYRGNDMNIQELRLEMRDLGFEDDAIFSDETFENTFCSSVTRALKIIATTVKAPIGRLDLELDETGRYDLSELTKVNNKVTFDEIDRIVENTDKGIKTFGDYELEQDKILVLDPELEKSLTVFYKQRILPVTPTTPYETDLQIEYICEPLLGLLVAHYVWLDDDERKAVMYWNEYDQLKQEILARVMKPRARFVTEF